MFTIYATQDQSKHMVISDDNATMIDMLTELGYAPIQTFKTRSAALARCERLYVVANFDSTFERDLTLLRKMRIIDTRSALRFVRVLTRR